MQDDKLIDEEIEAQGILIDEAQGILIDFMESHESDIAIGINDFGDLKPVFIGIFGREPEKPVIGDFSA